MVKIELLKNGMVVFDNGTEVMQTRPEYIDSIRIFAPERNNPCYGNKFNNYRLQVSGKGCGYITFTYSDRCCVEHIRDKINRILSDANNI